MDSKAILPARALTRSFVRPVSEPARRTLQPRSTIRLDLTRGEDELLAGFSKGHRADIKRAERDGVTIRVGSVADIDVLHADARARPPRASSSASTAPPITGA